jgi:hypothetical protein
VQFIRETPAQRFCSERCRVRLANKTAYRRKREREDAAQRAQVAATMEQNTREGIDNLQWSNGHGQA